MSVGLLLLLALSGSCLPDAATADATLSTGAVFPATPIASQNDDSLFVRLQAMRRDDSTPSFDENLTVTSTTRLPFEPPDDDYDEDEDEEDDDIQIPSKLDISWTTVIILLSSVAAVAMLLLLSFLMLQRSKRVHYMEPALPMAAIYQPSGAAHGQHAVSQWLKARQYHPLHVAAMLNDLPQLDALLRSLNPIVIPSSSLAESPFSQSPPDSRFRGDPGSSDVLSLSPPPFPDDTAANDSGAEQSQSSFSAHLFRP